MMLDASAAAPAGEPDSDERRIVARLAEILEASDLENTTGKSIRKQLQKELGKDLSAYKPLIKSEIEKYLQGEALRQSQESALLHVTQSQSVAGSSGVTKPKGGYGSLLSPELSAFMGGAHEMARTQVVKKLWEYIKANGLQNAQDKRKIDLDGKLATLFKPPLTMFNMNKQLSRHCKTDDRRKSTSSSKPKKSKAAVKSGGVKKTKPKKKAKKEAGADGEKKRRGGGGFGVCRVLGPLASFMGTTEAKRTDIVKKVWAHIKEHNCKDPNDGRNIIPDGTLGTFLTAPVTMFTMQKQLSAYLEKIPNKKPKVEPKVESTS